MDYNRFEFCGSTECSMITFTMFRYRSMIF